MSMRRLRAGLPGLAQYCSFLSTKSLPTKSSAIASFRPRSGSTIPASTTNSHFRRCDNFHTGDDPSVRQRDFSGEFSKRITEAFAVSFGSTFTSLKAPGGPTGMGANGFQNFETTFKYRVYRNPEHEFVMSVGLSVEWGGTGAESVGAEQFNTYTPTFYFGKGFGDLPDTLVLDSAGRRHRPGRLCDSGKKFDHDVRDRSGQRRSNRRYRISIRAC